MPPVAASSRINRLLQPQSIAVIGGDWSRSVIEQCQLMGFAGEIWPIHPQHNEICGLNVYRDVADLPAAPDAVFIGVNRHATVELVKQLALRGAGSAVCFASGFSESSAEDDAGKELQQQLIAAAGDMTVLGPNCYGLINYLDGALLWPDQHGGQRVDRGVAIITQSSNIAINMTMQNRALPVAYVMTAGNQAQTTIADMGLALLDDDRVTALGLHIEGLTDIAGFEAMAAKARRLGKGIIAIKVGRSVKAREAMVSHTNSLSGSDAASDAFFTRLGIARVNSIPVLLEALKLCHVFGVIPIESIASMSCSGGEAGLMADSIQSRELKCHELSSTQRTQLRHVLGSMVALANPLDYHTYIWNDLEKMTATFAAMVRDGADLTFLVIDFPRADRCTAESWMPTIDALVEARNLTGSNVALLATMHENLPESVAIDLLKKGIPCFFSIDEALDATVAAAFVGAVRSTELHPLLVGHPVDSETKLLSEAKAKNLLAGVGLSVPESQLVSNSTDAVVVAQKIGFPVVVKVSGIAHKTESGGVVLDLHTPQDVQAAAGRLLKLSDFILVERYITGTVAELIVGIVREPDNTFLLTIGAGGMFTELIKDSVSLLLPVTPAQVKNALGSLKVAAVLNGYRAGQGADIESTVQSILMLCDYTVANTSLLDELEVNPLVCLPHGCFVADALIRMRVQNDTI